MKDPQLAQLNFVELLDYKGQPLVQNRYSPPLPCSGYCIDCEQKGLLNGSALRLDKMSHGCDSSDYVALLGPLQPNQVVYDVPIMFLLDGPGGDYDLGAEVQFRGFNKRPPTKHYYWSPEIGKWPTAIDEFGGNFCAPYFAYLMRRHGLSNVYITNATKCDWVDDSSKRGRINDPAILRNCLDRWLSREIQIVSPEIIFCFGRQVEQLARQAPCVQDQCPSVIYLSHPSAIASRHQVYRKTKQQMVDENDKRVVSGLKQLKHQPD